MITKIPDKLKNLKILKLSLAGTFAVIFLYNTSVALDQIYEVDGDAWDYVHLGLSIAKAGKYGHFEVSRDQLLSDFQKKEVENKNYVFSRQTAFRPPIWPALIAGVFLIFGYDLSSILIFKLLVHFLGIFIFYKTLKLLKLKEVLVIIGTFFYAVSPAWQIYSRVFLSEPVTFFFITLWVYFLIRNVQKKSGLIPQGLVGGLLILSHPYYLFLPFTVWFILFLYRQMKFKAIIISSFLAVIVVTMWVLRNSIVMDTDSIVLTTSSGAVLAKGWNKDVVSEHTNTKGDLANEWLVIEDYPQEKKSGYNEVQQASLHKDAVFYFIKTNPGLVLPIIGKKLLSAFNPFPETPKPGFLETGRWIFHLLALLALIYILIFSRNRLILSLAIGLIFSTIIMTIITYSGFRFRMPQAALELLLITVVVEDLLEKRRRLILDRD